MKMLAALALLLFALAGQAQNSATNPPATNAPAARTLISIPAREARDHTNSEAIVTGVIAEVHQGGSVVHLNFDKPFPNQTFTAVIFGKQISLFPELDQLKGKTVEVTGKIVEYNRRPEIVLNGTNQLRVIEKEATPAEKK